MRDLNHTARWILELVLQGNGPKSHITDHIVQICHGPVVSHATPASLRGSQNTRDHPYA